MFYNLVKMPTVVKTGVGVLAKIDEILLHSHLYFPNKILITQPELYSLYYDKFEQNSFSEIVFVQGGAINEFSVIKERCATLKDALLIAFGGGSVLDIVKYSASQLDIPFLSVPSTLSNDAIYSCVARLISDGKKRSYGVHPPVGIIVDLDIIRNSPKKLILAGVADLVSNLSAIQDWLLSHNSTGEPINELAYMLAKEAAISILNYNKSDLQTDAFLFDLTNGLITSGLSMIISGDTRGTSGAEHLISHAIDEYFPERATIHGIQVGWAHLMIEKKLRNSLPMQQKIEIFFSNIGLLELIEKEIPWSEDDIYMLMPYAIKMRSRYTILNEAITK